MCKVVYSKTILERGIKKKGEDYIMKPIETSKTTQSTK